MVSRRRNARAGRPRILPDEHDREACGAARLPSLDLRHLQRQRVPLPVPRCLADLLHVFAAAGCEREALVPAAGRSGCRRRKRDRLIHIGTAMSEYRLLPAGDTALVVEFGDRIDRQLSLQVLALAQRLNETTLDGIVECVPTFRSLMVHYDPLVLPASVLKARIATLMRGLRTPHAPGRLWRLPACYDESLAADLDDVAARTSRTPAQIIERHSAPAYHVFMLGFLPGQAYMGDVAEELMLPRRETPRMKIPAGSLAMAMAMTCIFPQETPCGWHLIGRSPA